MRSAEIAYWNEVAGSRTKETGFNDNIWKRQGLIRRLLDYNWIGESVLEVGVGYGLTAAVINLMILGKMEYLGTDLSDRFCDYVSTRWRLKTVHTDVRSIPTDDEQFSRILCLDSLEHVRPEDREQGYKEIYRVAEKNGLLLINMPLDESRHNPEFDYAFGLKDLEELEAVGFKIERYEKYSVYTPNRTINYGFAVLRKQE